MSTVGHCHDCGRFIGGAHACDPQDVADHATRQVINALHARIDKALGLLLERVTITECDCDCEECVLTHKAIAALDPGKEEA